MRYALWLGIAAVAVACALQTGCQPQGDSTNAVAPPPPAPEAAPPQVRTFDYTHKVVVSSRRRGGCLYTVAILRFGDTTEVEGQPFGKARPTDDGKKPAGGDVNVNVEVKLGPQPADRPVTTPPQINKRAREILKHQLVQSEAFAVIERERILEILREINLGKTKYVDPETAPDEGKLISVQYLIEGSLGRNEDRTLKDMLGEGKTYKDVEEYHPSFLENLFSPGRANRKRRLAELQKMRMAGLQRRRAMQTFDTACYLSVYDVHTGQVVCTVMGLGTNGLEAIRDAVEELVEEMPEKVGNGIRVAAVTGQKIYLDVGKRGGVKVGGQFEVIHRGKPIRDRHGTIIGHEETEAGEIEITEVKELLSVAKIVRKAGQIARGDVARRAKH